jgi:hypothetical protein
MGQSLRRPRCRHSFAQVSLLDLQPNGLQSRRAPMRGVRGARYSLPAFVRTQAMQPLCVGRDPTCARRHVTHVSPGDRIALGALA